MGTSEQVAIDEVDWTHRKFAVLEKGQRPVPVYLGKQVRLSYKMNYAPLYHGPLEDMNNPVSMRAMISLFSSNGKHVTSYRLAHCTQEEWLTGEHEWDSYE